MAASRSSRSLIDRIQDRYGKTIFRHDERDCEGCIAGDLDRARPSRN